LWLEHLQRSSRGKLLDRARRGPQAAAGRPIRLRQYQRNIVTGIKQRGQRARCKFGSAGEY